MGICVHYMGNNRCRLLYDACDGNNKDCYEYIEKKIGQ